MKVNGIIAEYNPFHNGHLYQIKESAQRTGCNYTIVVMSGNFVQRGAPAVVEKRIRTEAALRHGADLVLELPVLYAMASAEAFAAGAVALLDRLGVVTHLCFGSEYGNTDLLEQLAKLLSEESLFYRAVLQKYLKQGFTYPAARVRALAESAGSSLPQNAENLMASPNNILGIEYIRALYQRRSAILPVTVKRLGTSYHDAGLPASKDQASAVDICSALALRQALCQGKSLSQLSSHMPPNALTLLEDYLQTQKLLCVEDFSAAMYYKLIAERDTGYEKYLDVSSDLSDRIRKCLNAYTGLEAFCDILKTKNMTYTRVSRCLFHILLGIEKKDLVLGKALDYTPYARVLGFKRSAASMLKAIGQHSDIPLVTSLADAKKSLTPEEGRLLQLDIFASELYQYQARLHSHQTIQNEISTPPVML